MALSPGSYVGRTLGHYLVVEEIGRGGMGVVYRAHDQRLDRDVALKVLPTRALGNDNLRKRFRTEALAVSTVSHPNIAVVHDFDSQDGVDFLITEYVPGRTLDEKLAQGSLSEAEVISLGTQLAEGLAAAHAQGVVHRDIKPSNLRITPEGRLKILDFGLAKLQPKPTDETISKAMTLTGTTVGTVPYMSPEQLRGDAVDARTDVYAMGAVLYELQTGRRPFPQKESAQLIAAILKGCPTAPRELNPAISGPLEQITLKCLELDPSNRCQSAAEVATDLKLLSAGETRPRRGDRAKRAWPVRLGSSAALLAILAAVAFLWNPGGWRERLFGKSAQIESIAVLPLQNFSGDPQQDYFAAGMTDELITQLAQTTNLRVISRSSIMQYKDTKKTIPEIAHELHVDAVLEGSVQRVGDHVRIQAQLIYAPQDKHLWAQQYDREISDVMALQDEVSTAIAREVGGKLSEPEGARPPAPHKVNPEAYEAYLHGLEEPDSLSKAIAQFDRAIQLQPDFAQAYAAKANALFFVGFFGLQPPNQAFPKMEAAAEKAVELDPTLSDGHGALALAKLQYDWDFAGAEKEFRRALELNPSNSDIHHMYAHYLLAVGRIRESVDETRLAAQLDPAGESFQSCLPWHELSGRHYDRAEAETRAYLRSEPNDFWAHLVLGWTFEAEKRFPDATAELKKAEELSGGSSITEASLAHVLAVSGKRGDAEKILEQMEKQEQKSYVPAYDIAVLHLGMGDKQGAIDWLQKASVERSGFLVYINWDPRFDVLRSDPRFIKLLQQIGLPTRVT